MFYRITLKAGYYSGTYEKFDTQEDADVSASGDTTVSELPPYADIEKAKSCYLANGIWIFDEVRYEEALEEEKRIESILTNEQISQKLDVLEEMINELVDVVIPTMAESFTGSILKETFESLLAKL